MKFLVVLASLVALIEGLPQYSYPAPSHTPSISYGTPGSGLSIPGGSGFTSGGAGFGVGGGSVAVGHGISGVGTGYTSGVGTGFTSGVGTGFTSSVGTGFTSAGGTGFTSGGGGTGFTSGGGGAGGGVLVQKHIYVHVAPEEPEEVKQQAAFAARQATKHYKIIFIKAPSPPTYTAPILQAQAQNQEKTLVYVLVKKPEEQQDIVVPTASSQAPSKPEVYFIRYKAKTQVSGGGAVGGGAIGGGAIGGGAIGGGAIGGGAIGGGVISGGSIGGGLIGGTGVGGGDIGISTGISSSSIGIGRPSTQYGPPGHSAGPY